MGLLSFILHLNPFVNVDPLLNMIGGEDSSGNDGTFGNSRLDRIANKLEESLREAGHTVVDGSQLLIAFLVLVGLIIVRTLVASISDSISSMLSVGRRPTRNRRSPVIAGVFIRLITEDLARIASLLGQDLGGAILTLAGYLFLYIGLKNAMR